MSISEVHLDEYVTFDKNPDGSVQSISRTSGLDELLGAYAGSFPSDRRRFPERQCH